MVGFFPIHNVSLDDYHEQRGHDPKYSENKSLTRYTFHKTLQFSYGYVCTGVRLRKASLVRNHHTPLDFVTDRYRSQLLRYTIFTIQILASFVYLSAQVNSLQSTFNSMFGFDPSEVWPVVVIMAIILGTEN